MIGFIMSGDALKHSLRQEILKQRNALSLKEKKKRSYAVIERFMGNVPFEKKDIIGAYYPLGHEVDIKLMLPTLQEKGYRVALPCIIEKDAPMIFRNFTHESDLISHSLFRIWEPPATHTELFPTIITIPLAVCDEHGNRIGFGGGYYDRTLPRLAQRHPILTVGIAYDFQVIAYVPSEPHDYPLDCIITDKRVILCNNTS